MKFFGSVSLLPKCADPASVVAFALTAALASGCATRAVPLSQPDPSDPKAAIGVEEPYRPSLAEDFEEGASEPHAAPATDPHTHDDTPEAELTYACPMHPEITGKQGDRCSKCGMDLVLVEPSP